MKKLSESEMKKVKGGACAGSQSCWLYHEGLCNYPNCQLANHPSYQVLTNGENFSFKNLC